MLRPHAHRMDMSVNGSEIVAMRLANWMAMTLAMMLPLVIRPIRFAAERSLWQRRHRAIAGFLIGYLGCWLLVGLPVAFVTPGPLFAAVIFGFGAWWQLTRRRRFVLAACHRSMPLAPRGWRADRDSVLYGWRTGTNCALSCLPLMLACALLGHALPAMILGMAVAIIERYTFNPSPILLSAAQAVAAVISLLMTI